MADATARHRCGGRRKDFTSQIYRQGIETNTVARVPGIPGSRGSRPGVPGPDYRIRESAQQWEGCGPIPERRRQERKERAPRRGLRSDSAWEVHDGAKSNSWWGLDPGRASHSQGRLRR